MAPSDREHLAWFARKAAELGDTALLACADCGRRDTRHYVQPQHPYWAGGREDVARCGDCLNAINVQMRAERKTQLAGRPKDCARCGTRPHTWRYAGWKLCGRCYTATRREHATASGAARVFAIFATAPMVDTSTWAGAR